MSQSAPDNPTVRRFRIALSFPGEHRSFVEQVAEHLSTAVGRERVLYAPIPSRPRRAGDHSYVRFIGTHTQYDKIDAQTI